ncbi:MAG: 16S rRNA (cytidine(1402)-2'-O)-methyltransferase [Firmicutes bacterium]|nr:16S rRNA (cytidine(1402)-2'-O)-methyltransferase [Bacillota bacterium]
MIQKSYDNTPTVYLIPTPIGNLEDITLRAINVLKQVEVIFSEDTRVTGLLLQHLNIKKRLISSHEHNENDNIVKMIGYLNQGKDVGIVTDRGTPIISDPGYGLVKGAIAHKYNVVGLPGPTALIPALITSGISPSPFLFYGFLNSKDNKRIKELEQLRNQTATIIFYESPHRLMKLLQNIYEVLGNRQISISREISKKYEEIIRGKVSDIVNIDINIKGEFVIVLEGNTESVDYTKISITEHVNAYIKEGNSVNEAIKATARDRGITKKEVYNDYHQIKK